MRKFIFFALIALSEAAFGQNPTVNAGADQTMMLPAPMAFLHGSATGNGGHTIASYSWTQISGPFTLVQQNSSQPIQRLFMLLPGTYQFKLTATDNASNTASDTMTLTLLQQRYVYGPGEYTNMMQDNNTHILYNMTNFPTVFTGMPTYTRSLAGGSHWQCVIDSAGNGVWGIGDNGSGNLGNGVTGGVVNSVIHVTTDSAGNPLTNIQDAQSTGTATGGTTWLLKRDGTVWAAGATDGGMRGNGTAGGTNNKFVQVPFPAGTFIVKLQAAFNGVALDSAGNVWTWGGNVGFMAPYVLAQNSASPNTTVPAKISLPGRAKDIAGGYFMNYALLESKSLYGWSYIMSLLGVGGENQVFNQPGAQLVPILLDSSHLFQSPVAKIWTNNVASYAILEDSTLRAWGDCSTGAIGNGVEPNYLVYKNGTSSAPEQWDQALGDSILRKQRWISQGIHTITNVFTGRSLTFYYYSETLGDTVRVAGRNKGGVLGIGVEDPGNGNVSVFQPNAYDVPWATKIRPLSFTANIPTASPYCALFPSSANCSDYAIPVTSPPNATADAHQTIGGTTAALHGVTSGNGGSKVISRLWTQVSGPNNPLIIDNTSDTATLTGMQTGTYIFQLLATDNNQRTKTVKDTITIGSAPPVVSAGANQSITIPVSSLSLTGTATAQGSATISSTTWTQISGPVTGVIVSASSLTTVITGLSKAGIYVFQLSATDSNGSTSTATATVFVQGCDCINAKLL